MFEGNPFISNPGASPWITTAPGPGLIRHNVRTGKRQQLFDEASRLTPDQQELVGQLMDRELSPADAAYYGNQLNQGLKGFTDKYNENPFYAFSREGRETVSSLQRLVRDPRLVAAERAHKLSQETYKKLDENKMLNLVDVEDGKMKVLSREDGSVMSINPDNFDPERYAPVTMGQLHEYVASKKGYFDKDISKIQPLAHSMEAPDKVIDQVNKWFGGLGQTQRESFNDLVMQKTTDNAGQITARLNALYDKTGLPQAFRDTIYSQYYTEQISNGQKPTRQGAEKALADNLNRIASGYSVFKTDTEKNPALEGVAAKAALGEVSRFEFGASGAPGMRGSIDIGKADGKGISLGYHPLDKNLLDISNSSFKDEGGVQQPSRNVKDSRLFNAIDNNDMYIPDLNNAGKLVQLPAELRPFLGGMILDKEVFGGTFTKFDANGRYVSAYPGVEAAPDGSNVDRAFFTSAKFRAASGGGDDYDRAVDKLRELGYSTRAMKAGELTEYKNNTNNPDFPTDSWMDITSPEAFDIQLFGVYKNPKVFNDLDKLPMGLENKQRQLVYPTSNATQEDGNAINNNPLSKAKAGFATFDELNKGK